MIYSTGLLNGYFLIIAGLRNYHKSILLLRASVLGRLRDLQYIFAVTYETLCTCKISQISFKAIVLALSCCCSLYVLVYLRIFLFRPLDTFLSCLFYGD